MNGFGSAGFAADPPCRCEAHTRSTMPQTSAAECTGRKPEGEKGYRVILGRGEFSFTLPTAAKTKNEKDPSVGLLRERAVKVQSGIGWSSFVFSVLQSVCTFFAALGGLRLLIGAGALAAATQAGIRWDHFHQNWIRIPMVGFAVGGALLNLVILWQIRRLRNHPAAQWRRKPVPASKTRMEQVQFVLSWITLVLIGIEEVTHFRTFHHF